VVTSVLGLRYYSGESIEVMFFLLFMSLVIIGIASIINVSLSIDLIAEAKIRELKVSSQKGRVGKKMILWGFGVFGLLVVLVIIGDFLTHRRRKNELEVLTAEVIQAHQGNLERIWDYMEDTSQILKTPEVLVTVNRSSKDISTAEALLIREVLGKESILSFSSGTDSGSLTAQSFEDLVVVPSAEEKQLLQELFSGEKTGAQVLEFGKGEIRGYYPISKGTEVMVVRVNPTREFKGVGGRR